MQRHLCLGATRITRHIGQPVVDDRLPAIGIGAQLLQVRILVVGPIDNLVDLVALCSFFLENSCHRFTTHGLRSLDKIGRCKRDREFLACLRHLVELNFKTIEILFHTVALANLADDFKELSSDFGLFDRQKQLWMRQVLHHRNERRVHFVRSDIRLDSKSVEKAPNLHLAFVGKVGRRLDGRARFRRQMFLDNLTQRTSA